MVFSCCLLGCCLLPGSNLHSGGAEDQIAIFVIDNEGTPAWKNGYLAAFERTNTLKKVEGQGQLSFWKSDRYAKYRGDNPFRGYVRVVRPNGTFEKSYFSSLKDEKAFEERVRDIYQKRLSEMPEGLSPTVVSSGDVRTVQTPEYKHRDNPRLRSLANDSHLRYSDRVLAIGRDAAGLAKLKRLPLPEISRLARQANGKMWYFLCRPQVVPPANRSAAIGLVTKAANVGLQQRNAEGDPEYRDRRLISDTLLSLTKSLAFDVKQITAFTEWPTEPDQPFRANARLVAENGTSLSRMIKQLNTSQSLEFEAGNLGYLKVALTMPNELRPVAIAWVRQFLEGSQLTGLEEAIENGTILASVRLNKDADALGAIVVTPVKLKGGDHAVLASALGGVDGKLRGKFVPSFEGVRIASLAYRVHGSDEGLAIGVSTTETLPDLNQAFAVSNESELGELLDLRLDLKPLIADKGTERFQNLLQNVEQAYTRTLRPQGPAPATGRAQGEATSLLSDIKRAGDWSLAVTLRATGNTLVLNVEVGADLHALWRVRQKVR